MEMELQVFGILHWALGYSLWTLIPQGNVASRDWAWVGRPLLSASLESLKANAPCEEKATPASSPLLMWLPARTDKCQQWPRLMPGGSSACGNHTCCTGWGEGWSGGAGPTLNLWLLSSSLIIWGEVKVRWSALASVVPFIISDRKITQQSDKKTNKPVGAMKATSFSEVVKEDLS